MKYNNGLKKLHRSQREKTIETLQNVLQIIKAFEGENTPITAKKIIDNSNLSRAVLYKEHLLKVWNPNLWRKKQEENAQESTKYKQKYSNELRSLIETNNKLTSEINKYKTNIEQLSRELEISKSRAIAYKADYEEEKIKYQRQLGLNQKLNDKLYGLGLNSITSPHN